MPSKSECCVHNRAHGIHLNYLRACRRWSRQAPTFLMVTAVNPESLTTIIAIHAGLCGLHMGNDAPDPSLGWPSWGVVAGCGSGVRERNAAARLGSRGEAEWLRTGRSRQPMCIIIQNSGPPPKLEMALTANMTNGSAAVIAVNSPGLSYRRDIDSSGCPFNWHNSRKHNLIPLSRCRPIWQPCPRTR
jgi:hypothetical protein